MSVLKQYLEAYRAKKSAELSLEQLQFSVVEHLSKQEGQTALVDGAIFTLPNRKTFCFLDAADPSLSVEQKKALQNLETAEFKKELINEDISSLKKKAKDLSAGNMVYTATLRVEDKKI
jgi:hypothetical protein